MRKFFKSLICIVTSLVILTFSVVSIPVSAAITPEQEILNYCLVTKKDYFEQGIPYLPSYFQNLNGWTNNKAKWTNFISKSVYPNRMYYTRVLYSGSQVTFYIINYDEITAFSGNVTFKNCVIATFSASGVTSDNPSMSLNVEEHVNNNNYTVPSLLATNYSGWTKGYINFSGDSTVVTPNGLVLSDVIDGGEALKKINDDLWDGSKAVLFVDDNVEAGYDCLSGFYVTFKEDLASKLSSALEDDSSTTGSHSGGGIQRVQVGDDTFNEIATDLKNNTITSNIWNNLDTTTTNSIRNTYNNLKNVVENSFKAYTDSENNYYYAASTSSGDSNYFNYNGDSTTYYQTFIYDDGTDGNVTTAPASGGSSGSGVGSGSGAYAEANASANAEGGNAEINQGDININIGGDTTSNTGTSGTGSSDTSTTEIDVGSFEKLLNSCSKFWDLLKNIFSMYPEVVWTCVASGITVVVICRLLGR